MGLEPYQVSAHTEKNSLGSATPKDPDGDRTVPGTIAHSKNKLTRKCNPKVSRRGSNPTRCARTLQKSLESAILKILAGIEPYQVRADTGETH